MVRSRAPGPNYPKRKRPGTCTLFVLWVSCPIASKKDDGVSAVLSRTKETVKLARKSCRRGLFARTSCCNRANSTFGVMRVNSMQFNAATRDGVLAVILVEGQSTRRFASSRGPSQQTLTSRETQTHAARLREKVTAKPAPTAKLRQAPHLGLLTPQNARFPCLQERALGEPFFPQALRLLTISTASRTHSFPNSPVQLFDHLCEPESISGSHRWQDCS